MKPRTRDEVYRQKRKPVAPPGHIHKDPRKEESKKRCRDKRIPDED